MDSAFCVDMFLFPFQFHNVESPTSLFREILFTSVKTNYIQHIIKKE